MTHVQFQYGGLLHKEQECLGKPAIQSVNDTIANTFEYPERIEITRIDYAKFCR